MRQHWLTHPEATMTPIALPQAIVRALRDPVPDAKDFTPTKFQPAASKAWFVGHCVKFISADFPRHQFTSTFRILRCMAEGVCKSLQEGCGDLDDLRARPGHA